MPIVRHGRARMRCLEPPVARPRGPRRPTTTATTAQAIPTTGVPTRRRSRRNAMPRRTTATAAILRSRTPIIRHPHARIPRHRPREPTPRRAVAIQLRRAPTPPRATAIAVAAAPVAALIMAVVEAGARTAQEAVVGRATAAVAVAEAHMGAEALPLTVATTKFFTQTPEPARIFLAGFCIYLLTSSTPAASLPSPASPAPSSAP
jgi:hypothetical protein